MKPKLVLIEWLDSHRFDGWHTDKPATKPLRCTSVGWLVYDGKDDGKDAKTVAPHMSDEEPAQRCGEMTIPARAILRIRELTPSLKQNSLPSNFNTTRS